MDSTNVRFIRVEEVCRTVGLQKSQVYNLERNGSFPKRIKLTPRSTVWRSDEIIQWVEERTADARSGT